jgi:alpha-galactosidase
MACKIALIGAGSAMFSLSLVRDLCLTPGLAASTVTFMDIDRERLDAVHTLCTRFAAEVGITLELERTTDRREALRDADFVINTALVTGHAHMRDGWEIARRHGYRFGGSLHVMHDEAFWINFHQFRLFDELTRDMLDICPDAWCLLVANPVYAGTTYLGRHYTPLKIVGLCHGFSGVYHLADELGIGREGLQFEIPGVNHFVWLTRLEQDGIDRLPLIDRWLAQKAPSYWQSCPPSNDLGPKPFDLYRRFGRFPIGDTANPGGGAWPWWYHTDAETERRWHEDPDWWWSQIYFASADRTVAEIRRLTEDPAARVTDVIAPQKSGEVMIDLIEAIVRDIPRRIVGNLLNTGDFVPGVPRDIAVEVPMQVDGRGVHGTVTTALPRAILARLWRDRVAPLETELAAYREGSRELLLQLILMDPFTRSLAQAQALLDDILALPYHEAMRRHYR